MSRLLGRRNDDLKVLPLKVHECKDKRTIRTDSCDICG